MAFKVGDKVVYPHHGAATIEKRERVEAFGEKREYLILKLAYGELTLKVPTEKAEEIGLRDIINDEEVEEVFAVLRKKEARTPSNWSRRYKNHVEKLKSGDIYQVAEVVRNLSLREKDKGLSAGEKRMLGQARQILVSELTFAIGVDRDEAEIALDEVLAGGEPTARVKTKKAAAAKKTPAKKTAAKKAPATNDVAEKAPAIDDAAEKAPAKESPAKKAPAKKAPAKKAPATKAVAKSAE